MKPPLWALLPVLAGLASAGQPTGHVLLTSGRTVAAIAYEILGDQVKVTQPDQFVLYFPLAQVDLEATATSLGGPGPPPKPGEMRKLWIKKTEGRQQKSLGVVESLEAWKRDHPKSGSGALSVDASKVAADGGAPSQAALEPPGDSSRIEPARGPGSDGAAGGSPIQNRRRELAERLYQMRANPDKYTQGEYTRLQEEINAFDQELYERQQRAWEQRNRP